jgi:archaeal flagellin FlaB
MKKIIVLLLGVVLLFGTASAYGIYLNCAETTPIGQTLKCSIDSDLPSGTGFDLVLVQSQNAMSEIDRQSVTIPSNQATQYKLFDTSGLKSGQYKVVIQFNSATPSLRSDSIVSKYVSLTDRSSELTISSPTNQGLGNALVISGTLQNGGNDGIQIQVDGQSTGHIWGPQYISTNNGGFTQTISVNKPDDYIVKISDAKGPITTVTFHVTGVTTVKTQQSVAVTSVKVPVIETVGNIYGVSSSSGATNLNYLNVTLALVSGATSADLSQMQVSYNDGTTNRDSMSMDSSACSNTMAGTKTKWCIAQKINGNDNNILEPNEQFIIAVGMPATATPNTQFSVNLQPSVGANLPITRTVPPSINNVNVLFSSYPKSVTTTQSIITTMSTSVQSTSSTQETQEITPVTTVSVNTTKSVNELLEEQNKKIEEQNQLIAQQNKKLDEQTGLLDQIIRMFKGLFGQS